jgi:vacuolar-type H+-ATPase subunit H
VRRQDRPEPPRSLATTTAERLASIVEAAERAAVAVIDDAEKQGRARLEEAHAEADRIVADRLDSLSELTDSLVSQAEAIRGQSDRLLSSLEEARRRISAESALAGDEPMESEGPSRGSHLSAVAPVEEQVAAETTNSRPPAGARGGSAGARLLATQMAVSGSSREEIESRLRSGFEIEDTSSILDAILGPED